MWPGSWLREHLTREKSQCDQRPTRSRGSPCKLLLGTLGLQMQMYATMGGFFGGEFWLPLLSGVGRSGILLCPGQGSQGRAGICGKTAGLAIQWSWLL